MASFQNTLVSDAIPHKELKEEKDIELGTPPPVVTMTDSKPPRVHQGCYKCGKCMRKCSETDGSFCCSNANCEGCKCTPLSTAEGTGFIAFIISAVMSIIGICCMGCELCRRPNQPSNTCNFCGLILQVWQGFLFVASWFFGAMLLLLGFAITIRCSKRYGASCCRTCGCTSCARGFEDSPL